MNNNKTTARLHSLDPIRTVLLPLLAMLTTDDKVVVRQVVPEQMMLISEVCKDDAL
jgi:hypothetical protein